jgi:electron transport complex protein RnfB
MTDPPAPRSPMNRRQFFGLAARAALGAGVAGVAGASLMTSRARSEAGADPGGPRMLWQIDPLKCVQCGRCRTNCVMQDSAVKCVHDFPMCGYCLICSGFLQPGARLQNEAAENQLCPVGAIIRTQVQGEFFEYRVDPTLCTGCGICVKDCTAYGNGSLYLQVRQDRCLNCNECNIAVHCPTGAFMRVPASEPYVVKRLWLGRRKPDYVPFQKPPQLPPSYHVPTLEEGLEERGS